MLPKRTITCGSPALLPTISKIRTHKDTLDCWHSLLCTHNALTEIATAKRQFRNLNHTGDAPVIAACAKRTGSEPRGAGPPANGCSMDAAVLLCRGFVRRHRLLAELIDQLISAQKSPLASVAPMHSPVEAPPPSRNAKRGRSCERPRDGNDGNDGRFLYSRFPFTAFTAFTLYALKRHQLARARVLLGVAHAL